MSLLDTLGTDVPGDEDIDFDALPDIVGPSLADTFCDAEEMTAAPGVPLDIVEQPQQQLVLKRPAGKGKGGGRPVGTRAQAQLRRMHEVPGEEPVPKMSRGDRAKHAANSRWRKREAPKEPQAEVMSAAKDLKPLVPWVDQAPASMPDWPLADHTLGQLAVAQSAESPSVSMTVESKLVNHCRSVLSKAQLSKISGVDRKTATRKLRCMAAMVVLMRRGRSSIVMKRVHDELKAGSTEFEAILHVVKDKFDEVSLLLASRDSLDSHRKRAQGLRAENFGVQKPETSVAKILQVTRTVAALFKVDQDYVVFVNPCPTTCRSIESTSAESMRDGLERQGLTDAETRERFTYLSRLPISDQHRAILKSDYAMLRDRPYELLLKFVCDLHIQQKIAKLVFAGFPQDSRGLLHSTLSLQFTGCWRRFKDTWFEYIEQHLVIVDPAECTDDDNDHRDEVFRKYCSGLSIDSITRAPIDQIEVVYARREICNGRFKLVGRVEHVERGCCRNRQHTLTKWRENIIEREQRPPQWSYERRLGVEPSADFHGFWMESHNQFEPVYKKALLNIPWPTPSLDVLSRRPPEGAGDHAMGADEGAADEEHDGALGGQIVPFEDIVSGAAAAEEMVDPERDADTAKRQTTYRGNVRIWLSSRPRPRMWCLREMLRTQQCSQKELLHDCGPSFDERNQQAKRKNPRAQVESRILKAVNGRYVLPYMRAYGSLTANPWPNVPEEYITHSLEVSVYMSAAACSGANFQLRVVRMRLSPFLPFLMQNPGMFETISLELFELILRFPCKLDPFFFSLLDKGFRELNAIRGPKFRAILRFLEILIEIDNGSTEANNAALRRAARRAIQSKKLVIEDLGLFWIFKGAAQAHFEVWGSGLHPGDGPMTEEKPAEGDVSQKKTPGGGMQRAWVHEYKDEHRLESGCVDMTALNDEYNSERSKPFSQKIEDLKVKAARATVTHQANTALKQAGVKVHKSAFGTVKSRVIQSEARKSEMKMLSDELQGVSNPTSSSAAIVPFQGGTRHHQIVRSHAGDSLTEQMDVLRRLAIYKSGVKSQQEFEDRIQLRGELHREPVLGRVDLSRADLPSGGRLVPDKYAALPTFRWHDLCLEHACQSVAALTKHRKPHKLTAEALSKVWSVEHLWREADKLPQIGELPRDYQPTLCWSEGGGECLCQGPGILWAMAKRKLMSKMASVCPAKSPARRDLQQGRYVVQLQCGHFYHISICYLNPRRPTYVRCEFRTSCSWGGAAVFPCYLLDGQLQHCTDVEAMKDLNLVEPARCHMWQLRSTARRFDSLRPAARLLVERAEGPREADWSFWLGLTEELRLEQERQKEKAQREARARAKRGPDYQPKARAPRPVVARNQVSPNAGKLGAEFDQFMPDRLPTPSSPPTVVGPGARLPDFDILDEAMFEPTSSEDESHGVVPPSDGVREDMFWADVFSGAGAAEDAVEHDHHLQEGFDDDGNDDDLFGDGVSSLLNNLANFEHLLLRTLTRWVQVFLFNPLGALDPSVSDLFESVVVVQNADEGDELPENRTRSGLKKSSDHLAPPGCKFRKFARKDGVEFWLGTLRDDFLDDTGRHTRSRSWTGPRAECKSEKDAINNVLVWLRDWCA